MPRLTILFSTLVFLAVASWPSSSQIKRLLLFGDSIDRCTVIDWCTLQRNKGRSTNQFSWGGNTLRYVSTRGMMPSLICENGNQSIAFLHIFGSNSTGPYFKNFISSPGDPYVDTTVRLRQGYSMYLQTVGVPDLIIFQTEQWDAQFVIDFFENPTVNSALYNKSVAVFEENINARLDELINMTGGAIDIGVRTAVVINAHRALLLKYNEIVRATALRRNLTIFDFNDDIWSIIGFDATYESFLLRDWMHPKDVFTSIAGEKMLGNQYSRYMTIKRNSSYFENRFLSFYNDSTITVKLIRESRENESFSFNITQHHHAGVYFYMNGLRWSKPHHEFLKIARLGPGDVFLVSNETLQKIPEGPQVPNHIFLENTVLNWTTKGETYLIADGCRRKFTNVKSVEGGYKDYFVIERADDPWIQMIPFGNDLPDVFRDDTLVRLSGARECFIVRNGSRHSIPNLAVFLTLGRDFSEVKNLDWNDLNMIPLGLPLPG